jgi:hypothetical protein
VLNFVAAINWGHRYVKGENVPMGDIFVRFDLDGSIGLLRASAAYSAKTDPVLTTWRLQAIYIAITDINGI